MKSITKRVVTVAVALSLSAGQAVVFAPLASAASGCTYVAIGSSGGCVSELQQQLEKRGHSVGPAGVDGRFGPDTQAALISLQRAHNLLVDGEAGRQVWTFLRTGEVVAPGGGGGRAVAAPPPSTSGSGPKLVADISNRSLTYYLDGVVIETVPARFGGQYWDAVKEEVGYGRTPVGNFTIGVKDADMESNLFNAPMPDSMCFDEGVLYCIHGSPSFDAHGHTSPYFDGAAGSAGCINLKTWDAKRLFQVIPSGTPLDVVNPPIG